MNDYKEVRVTVTPCSEIATDILASILCDNGYESFVPDEFGLTAYIKAELFNTDIIDHLQELLPFENVDLSIDYSHIEGQDWNHEWEKNYFQPIVIGDNQCVIHSTFHTDYPQCKYDIVIDPKMAFGTGHHSTTSLIISRLVEMNLEGMSLLDMGTGTGILAILAAMRGASHVTAIEIDPMAYENALENVVINGHSDITVLLGDASLLAGLDKFDLMLANINRNIILNDIAQYVTVLHSGSKLLLSGFYTEDVPMLETAASQLGLSTVSVSEMNNWCCLELVKL